MDATFISICPQGMLGQVITMHDVTTLGLSKKASSGNDVLMVPMNRV